MKIKNDNTDTDANADVIFLSGRGNAASLHRNSKFAIINSYILTPKYLLPYAF